MYKTLIKICGLRDRELAQQAAQAGAHFIGLVFHPDSKRFVSIKEAKQIATATRQSGAEPVAVFVNSNANEMHTICEETGIRIVQLHGMVARQQHRLLPDHYQRIYVLPVAADGSYDDRFNSCKAERDFLLFDHQYAGSGKTFNWKLFNYSGNFRWILAGGLTPDNVSVALTHLQPSGVDVSSGVENNSNEKDILLIKNFINRAQSIEI